MLNIVSDMVVCVIIISSICMIMNSRIGDRLMLLRFGIMWCSGFRNGVVSW